MLFNTYFPLFLFENVIMHVNGFLNVDSVLYSKNKVFFILIQRGCSVLVFNLEIFSFIVIVWLVYRSECACVCVYVCVVCDLSLSIWCLNYSQVSKNKCDKCQSLFLCSEKNLYINFIKGLVGPIFKHCLCLMSI